MSLINEALKRARVEAARRDAAAKGVPPAALPLYVPRRPRTWAGPLAGFLAGLAAVVVATVAFSWVRGAEPAPETAAALPEVAPQPPVVASPPPVAARPSPSPTAGAAAPRAADPPPARRPSAASAPEPAPAHEPGAMAPEAVGEPSPPPPAPPPASRPAPRPAVPVAGEEGQTFRLEAQPAGGGKIKLDFIVWSESRPFAQLNGKQVSPGQTVDGYELLSVERERVRLARDGRTFWLRVR